MSCGYDVTTYYHIQKFSEKWAYFVSFAISSINLKTSESQEKIYNNMKSLTTAKFLLTLIRKGRGERRNDHPLSKNWEFSWTDNLIGNRNSRLSVAVEQVKTKRSICPSEPIKFINSKIQTFANFCQNCTIIKEFSRIQLKSKGSHILDCSY